MRTPPAAPYLLPPETAVADQPWTLEDGQPLSERLEHWDPFTDIEVMRSIEIDVDAVREACLLGDDAAFALTASWYSSRTRLAGDSAPVELGTLGGLVRAPLSLRVPGSAAGGRLDLRSRLVLRHPGAEPSPISPQREGATLWVHATRVALEGGSARFPVTAIDFTAVPRWPDEGSWALEWNSEDFDAPVLGGLRLLINAADDVLVGALRSGSADPRSVTIRAFIMYDVARALVRGALANESFVEGPEGFEEGTIGRMVFELLAMSWPGMPIKALRARSRDDPSRLDAELQAHLGILA